MYKKIFLLITLILIINGCKHNIEYKLIYRNKTIYINNCSSNITYITTEKIINNTIYINNTIESKQDIFCISRLKICEQNLDNCMINNKSNILSDINKDYIKCNNTLNNYDNIINNFIKNYKEVK